MINSHVNIEFSTEDSRRQVQKPMGSPIASTRIAGYFIPLENSYPQAQILLSCDLRRGKIPFG